MNKRELIKISFESGITIRCEIRFDENPKTAEALMRGPCHSKRELSFGQGNLLRGTI